MEMSLAQKAINLAISGEWNEAIKVNLQILSLSPDDVDSLNRLAKAYAEIGKITDGQKNLHKKYLQSIQQILLPKTSRQMEFN